MKKILFAILASIILSACTMQIPNQSTNLTNTQATSTTVAPTYESSNQVVLSSDIDLEIQKELSNLENELKKLDDADFGDSDLIGLE